MPRTRRNVWGEGEGWSEDLKWYAIGIRKLMALPVTDRTSWTFLAGIHGFSRSDWEAFDYVDPLDPFPSLADIDKFWGKCQHGSWYFLPWHRGYLSAFEQIVLAAIVSEGGPSDWALPYWNYSDAANPRAREIHPVFTEQAMPDGSTNALFTGFRFGTRPFGDLVVPQPSVSLDALKEPKFGSQQNFPGGFGGGKWPVSHMGGAQGELEATPHGDVHVAIGGRGLVKGRLMRGLMGAFETAGLDPVFWLHHANIDRLWEVWLGRNTSHANPTDPDWLGGPMDRPFVMPDVNGNEWRFACSDVIDTTVLPLDYVYDDTSDPLPEAGGLTEGFTVPGGPVVTGVRWEERDTELIAANEGRVALGPGGATVDISVPDETLRAASAKMMQETIAPEDVERYFLLLEDIRGADNSGIYEVYVDYGEPGRDLPSGLPREIMAGTFSTFGIEVRGEAEGAEPRGIYRLLDITLLVARMGIADDPDLGRLQVRIVPQTQAEDLEAPKIGRIAIYREST